MTNRTIDTYDKIILVGGGRLGKKFMEQIGGGIENKLIGVADMLSDAARTVKELCGYTIRSAEYYRKDIESDDVAIAWAIGAWQTIPALLEEFILKYKIEDVARIYVANPYTALRYFCVDDELSKDDRIPFSDNRYKMVSQLFQDMQSKQIYKRLIESKPFDVLDDPVEIICYEEIRDEYYMSEDYWCTYDFSNISVLDEATVIDGGAYIGDSVESICKALPEKAIYYYAFEPFPTNAESIKNNQNLRKFTKAFQVYACGISDVEGRLPFSLPENGDVEGGKFLSSEFSEKENGLEVRALDHMNLEVHGDLYIKMDIEGLELKALEGAKNLIRTYRPNLAICLYHRKNDLVEIPLYLKQLVPEYKFYLRGGFHTILWAMNEGQ